MAVPTAIPGEAFSLFESRIPGLTPAKPSTPRLFESRIPGLTPAKPSKVASWAAFLHLRNDGLLKGASLGAVAGVPIVVMCC
jgi:hypothetical protein